ncbi:DUF2336 domain-containing protein [Enterovirga rhinocerotis]|uniref:Uncharacterized protein (DUF2336 family) n=1 Tax=Enterovirga rhinocerotis TaxID=1339210 RepID=A0A4R7C678_9HYPH|nr:DUF2336 domain-containing protein [Enterovirga rhinocerotis]TDR93741.1 uncharacterized protein (DUF2336 family) [Enterovirga rhinocerotis]
MIVSRFLLWAREAPPGHRAEATAALARAFLYSDLSLEDRREAETALTAMLDDSSTLVRRAMADALGSAAGAPRHLIVALAGDASEVAAIVLGRSPLLRDGDLVDAAAIGDERIQSAIAARPGLSRAVSAALAEIGTAPALAILARNLDADIPDFSLARMVERHGEDAELREALLARPDLPVEIAQAVATALADALGRFVTDCGWLSPERSGRVTREARERATVVLSDRADDEGAARLVEHLRQAGQLTPALILRAILSRGMAFAEAAFADLSGIAVERVAAILRDERGSAFRSLYARAGMPLPLRPAFEASLAAYRETRRGANPSDGAALSRLMVERALAACEAFPPEETGRLVALLRRFEAEAAREEARKAAAHLADRAALALILEYAPQVLEDAEDGRIAA